MTEQTKRQINLPLAIIIAVLAISFIVGLFSLQAPKKAEDSGEFTLTPRGDKTKRPGANSLGDKEGPKDLPPKPLKASLSVRVREKIVFLDINFDSKVADPDILYKELKDKDGLVGLPEGGGFTAYFNSPDALKINTGLSEIDFERLLSESPLEISFSGRAGEISEISYPAGGSVPDVSGELKKIGPGKALLSLRLRPFTLELRGGKEGDDLGISLAFSRVMTDWDKEERPSGDFDPKEVLGLSLGDKLNLRAGWKSPRVLKIRTREHSKSFYLSEVMDKPFRLSLTQDLLSLSGESVKDAIFRVIPGESRDLGDGSFLVDSFRVLDFKAKGFTDEGESRLFLYFNRPVDYEALKEAVSVYRLPKSSGGSPEMREIVFIDREEDKEHTGLDPKKEPQSLSGYILELRVKASHGEELEIRVKDLRSADAMGYIVSESKRTEIVNNLTVSYKGTRVGRNYPWDSKRVFEISGGPLESELSDYLEIVPEGPYLSELNEYGELVLSGDFLKSEGDIVTVIFKKGLKGAYGILEKDLSFPLGKDSEDPILGFAGRGLYLSPRLSTMIRIIGKGADTVKVSGYGVYPDNLPFLLNMEALDANSRMAMALRMSEAFRPRESEIGAGKNIAFERLMDIKDFIQGGQDKEEGQDKEYVQDIRDRQYGTYLFKISPGVKNMAGEITRPGYSGDGFDPNDFMSNPHRYLPVAVTDLGLSARLLPGEIDLWVLSLKEGIPIPGVKVSFYDKGNRVLLEALTDDKGLVSAKLNPRECVFAIAEKDGDLSFLTFPDRERPMVPEDKGDLSGRGGNLGDGYYDDYDDYGGYGAYGGDFSNGGDGPFFTSFGGYAPLGSIGDSFEEGEYKAHLFIQRDLWKPGETVKILGIVRDRKLSPPEGGFPLGYRIEDPKGKVFEEGSAYLNGYGSLNFEAKIPYEGESGTYRVYLFVPGEKESIASLRFSVEDFIAPRIKTIISPDKTMVFGNAALSITLRSEWLFGAPGEGLYAELKVIGSKAIFSLEGYEGFEFVRGGRSFGGTFFETSGTLNENGEMKVSFSPLESGAANLPQVLNLSISAGVREESGRFSGTELSIPWFPKKSLIGIKAPSHGNLGEEIYGEVAFLSLERKAEGSSSSEETQTSPQTLVFVVSEIRERRYDVVKYGRVYMESEEELLRIKEEIVSLSDERALFSFTPERTGLYEISFRDPDDIAIYYSKRIMIHGGEAGETPMKDSEAPETLSLTLDKAYYREGETAALELKLPFPGFAKVTLETDEVLYSEVRDLRGNSGGTEINSSIFNIPVPALNPNAIITATLVRGVSPDGPAILTREISLESDRELYSMKLDLITPERITPGEELKIRVAVKDETGEPIRGELSVFFTDEGLLSMTGFRNRNPMDLFTQSLVSPARFYELYSALLPFENHKLSLLSPGGGEGGGELGGFFSPFRRSEEALSIFLTRIETDDNGMAEISLPLPEYSGRGRLVIIAHSGKRFGMLEKSLTVERELTLEPSLPLALAPGDSFTGSVALFLAKDAKEREGTLRLSSAGPLTVKSLSLPETSEGLSLGNSESQAESIVNFKLSPGERRLVYFMAEAGPGVGEASLVLDLGMDHGESFIVRENTVVRPMYPRSARSFESQIEGGDTEVVFDYTGFLEGTGEGTLTIAPGPQISVYKAYEFLRTYPYGCLEQTISRAWSFLAAAYLGLDLGDIETIGAEEGLRSAVKRIISLQSLSGGFRIWPDDSSESLWGTVLAAHFLTLAKDRIDIPGSALPEALERLREYLNMTSFMEEDNISGEEYLLSVKAYALYVLTLNGENTLGWINNLRERERGLSPSGLIFLYGSLATELGNSEPLKELEARKVDWNLSSLGRANSSYESPARNLALLLLMWTETDPLSKEARAISLKLSEVAKNGFLTNTQENGFALLALSRYLQRSSSGLPYEAEVLSPEGELLLSLNQRSPGILGPYTLKNYSSGPFTIRLKGEGRPYYGLTVSGVPSSLDPSQTLSQGLRLRKRLFREGIEILDQRSVSAAPRARGEEEGFAPPLALRRGELIRVELLLTSETEVQNVVISDLFPGGLEFERMEAPSAHMEQREDRAIIVIPHMREGETRTVEYSLRAVTEGEFALPPTAAEGMYQPEIRAYLPGGTLRVREKG
jgi:uncharacterized protein YfaS (alpha-2-macroglobulin family)